MGFSGISAVNRRNIYCRGAWAYHDTEKRVNIQNVDAHKHNLFREARQV